MLDGDNGEISTRKLAKNCYAFIWCSIKAQQFYTDIDLHHQC